jgi:hypothetical protein
VNYLFTIDLGSHRNSFTPLRKYSNYFARSARNLPQIRSVTLDSAGVFYLRGNRNRVAEAPRSLGPILLQGVIDSDVAQSQRLALTIVCLAF